eukprot:406009-Prorocentrum_lima.AAC.1
MKGATSRASLTRRYSLTCLRSTCAIGSGGVPLGHSTRGRLRGKRIRNGDFLKQVYHVDQWALQDVAWSPEEEILA